MRRDKSTAVRQGAAAPLDEAAAFRLLVSNSRDLLTRHAPDGTYRYASPAARQLLGYDPGELVGRSPYDLFHPDDVPTVVRSHDAILGMSDSTTIRYRMRHKDGHYVWFETISHTIRAPDTGDVLEIQASSRDVSAGMRAEAELRESEQRFRLAMSNAPIGMALVGLDGSFLAVNDTLSQLVGRSEVELATMTFVDISHPDDVRVELPMADRLRNGEISDYEIEKRYLHADGHEVWALLHRTLVRDDDGEPLYFISQTQDITERRRHRAELERMNEELLTSNAELEWFASMASHDLRSPLVTIRGILDMLLTRNVEQLPDEAVTWLQRAQSQAGRLLDNVEALLRMSRLGRAELVVEDVDLNGLIPEVVADLAVVVTDADADITASALPTVRADRAQMRLLFQNLVANSVKYRDPDRPLQISIDAAGHDTTWHIDVVDNGRGFDEDDREVIFQLFARGNAGQKLEGSGIGLATCRRIVERHGGSITAEPLSPGAQFRIVLPR